jgi:gamma-glutamyltranspeptidase
MYAPPSAQLLSAFRLHLHVAIFKCLKLAQKLWGEQVMNLYLHTLATHVGNNYEKMDFRNLNCEQGEASFAVLKKMLLASARRKDIVLDDVIKRLDYQRRVQKEYGKKKRKQIAEAQIEKEFRKHKWNDLNIEINDESKAFLNHLRSLNYQENTHFKVDDKKIYFITKTHITSYIASAK